MTFRYLLLECHTFEPYQLPHSPQRILLEKVWTPLMFSILYFISAEKHDLFFGKPLKMTHEYAIVSSDETESEVTE